MGALSPAAGGSSVRKARPETVGEACTAVSPSADP